MSRRKLHVVASDQAPAQPDGGTYQQPIGIRIVFTHEGQQIGTIDFGATMVLPIPEGKTPLLTIPLDTQQFLPGLFGAIQQKAQQAAGGLIVPGRNAPLPDGPFDPRKLADAKALLKRND